MKKKEVFSNRRQYIFLATGLLLVGVIVIFLCVQLVRQMDVAAHKEIDRYLGELSESTAMTVDSRMDMTFQSLDSIGETLLSMPEAARYAMGNHLRRQAEIHKFSWMSIVLKDDTIICSNHVPEHEETVMPGIAEAMNGQQIFTRVRSDSDAGEDGIVYSSPIYKDGSVIGVVTAWSAVETIRDALSVETLGGESFSLIIEMDGDYVVGSANKNAYVNADNFFNLIDTSGKVYDGTSLRDVQAMMQRGEVGILKYALTDEVEKTAHIVPLNYDNLFLLVVAPDRTASQTMDAVLRQSIFIILVVVALFVLLLIFTFGSSVLSQKKISRLAFQDPITGGISKLLFDVEAENRIRSAPPDTYRFIAMNIQKFKLINDNFGQEAGDRVLRYIYDTISALLGDEELVTRASADDFYILTKAKSKEEQEATFRLYSERINRFNFGLDKKYFINISLGIVLVDDPKLSLVQLRDRANMARKNAKHSYGELFSYVFYSDMERLQMLQEKDMENRMEDALRNEEFIVHLQPKIELEHNTVKGAEALVRWQTKDGKFVMPNDFIPFFEKNGFIVKLDLHVFEKTCALIRSWIDSGVEPVTVSVNMSRAHLNNPDFLKQYKEIAQRYEIPGELLEIELTESMVFENLDALIGVISQIHEAGFLCALDDFGSGYSSLSMLTDIEVDSLKLDKAFWKPSREGERTQDVIAMVVELGKRLNMTTVSEGVETISQLEFLRKIRCDLAQGYVFSKPVPPSEFELLTYGKIVSGQTEVPSEE